MIKDNLTLIKHKGTRDLFYSPSRDVLLLFGNIKEDKYSTGKNNAKRFRMQISRSKLDSIKDASLKMDKQVIILATYYIGDEPVYIFMDQENYLGREHTSNSSIWFNDFATIYSANKTKLPKIGSESSGKIDTLVFTEECWSLALDTILSKYPIIKMFTLSEEIKRKEIQRKMNESFSNDEFKNIVGYIGEYIFNEVIPKLNINDKGVEKIKWNYEIGNIYANHDFQIQLEPNILKFVEVKTTTTNDKEYFISDNEVEFIKKNKNAFLLVVIKLGDKITEYLKQTKKIDLEEIEKFIYIKDYEMKIYNGWKEINEAFNFEPKQYTLRIKNEK